MSEEDRSAEVKTWHRYCFGQQKEDMSRVEVRPEGFQRGCLSERKVEVIARRVAEDRKGVATNSGKCNTRV